jgi:hypothetical protein
MSSKTVSKTPPIMIYIKGYFFTYYSVLSHVWTMVTPLSVTPVP